MTAIDGVEDEPDPDRSEDAAFTDLVQRASAGDPAAVAELLDRLRPVVEGTARRVCRSSIDAEDVAQETWLALIQNIARIRDPACLPAWTARVARNTAARHGRRAARSVPMAELPEREGGAGSDDEAVSRAMRAAAIDALGIAFDRLRPAERRLVGLLMEHERPNYAAISAAVCRPVGSIGPTRRRILARLQQDPALRQLAPA